MNYKLEYSRNDSKKDITKQCGNVTWTDNEDTLGVAFSFDFAKVNSNKIENGDIIYFNNLDTNKNVFTGIVTSLDRGRLIDSIRCYDFAFYLNKSETIIQFNNISASAALKALFRKTNIPFNKIPLMATKVTRIFKGKVISEIIKEILEIVFLETGKQYRIVMDGAAVSIEEIGLKYVSEKVKLAENLSSFDISHAIEKSAILTESIEELKNSIIVASGDESDAILEHVKDDASINKFGFLQKVISVNENDEAQSRQIAKTLLNELNKVLISSSIRLLGNDQVKSGTIIELFVTVIGLVGMFKVKGITHNIAGSVYIMTLNIEGV